MISALGLSSLLWFGLHAAPWLQRNGEVQPEISVGGEVVSGLLGYVENVLPFHHYRNLSMKLASFDNSVPLGCAIEQFEVDGIKLIALPGRECGAFKIAVDLGNAGFPEILTGVARNSEGPAEIAGWRLPAVYDVNSDRDYAIVRNLDRGRRDSDIAADLSLTDAATIKDRAFGRFGAPLGLEGGFSRVVGSGTSRSKSEQPYKQATYAEIKRPLRPQGAFNRSIRSLPLSAKVGITVGLLAGAWLAFSLGFIRILQRSSNGLKALAYGLGGLVLFSASALPFW